MRVRARASKNQPTLAPPGPWTVYAGVPRSKGPKRRKLGARFSECLGTRCARDKGLGFSMDAAPPWVAGALFRRDKGWAKGPATARENKTKEDEDILVGILEYLIILDIMAKGYYLIQEAIYSRYKQW